MTTMTASTKYLIAAAAAVVAWMLYEQSKARPAGTSSTPARPPGATVAAAQATMAAQVAAAGNPGGQYDGFGGS